MPKRSPDYMEAQRQRFRDATGRCITRVGVAATSVQDICREAGLSAGALYTHYDSREALLADLVEERLERRNTSLLGASWAELKQQMLAYQVERSQPLMNELGQLCDWDDNLNVIRTRLGIVILEQLTDQLRLFAERGEITPSLSYLDTATFLALVFDGSIMRVRLDPELRISADQLDRYIDHIVGPPRVVSPAVDDGRIAEASDAA